MLGIGNAEFERDIILAVVVAVLALPVRAVFMGPRLVPQVPPTVAPLQHPHDEEVRELRHRVAQIDQLVPDLARRVMRHEEQITVVRRDLDEIKHATKRSEHMLNILVENGLREARE